MKKLFIMSLFLFTGCISNSPVVESFIPTSPIPSASSSPLSQKKIKVRHLDLSSANVTTLNGKVDNDSVNNVILDFNKFNKENKPIYLLIDSPGGNVIAGSRVIGAMETSKNKVTAICTGLCASMAFMILEHAHIRSAVPRSILMAHPAGISISVNGYLDQAVSRFSFLKRFVDKMDYTISTRVGMPYEKFKLHSDQEYWMDSEDALNGNFLDQIVSVTLPDKTFLDFGNNKLKESIRME